MVRTKDAPAAVRLVVDFKLLSGRSGGSTNSSNFARAPRSLFVKLSHKTLENNVDAGGLLADFRLLAVHVGETLLQVERQQQHTNCHKISMSLTKSHFRNLQLKAFRCNSYFRTPRLCKTFSSRLVVHKFPILLSLCHLFQRALFEWFFLSNSSFKSFSRLFVFVMLC